MLKPRSLAGRSRLAILAASILAIAVSVPGFAANSSGSGNTGGVAAASVTATKPSGLAVGDVMIASVSVRSNTATTITPVQAWNVAGARRITNSGNPDTQLSTYWKVADAADVALSGFQFNLSTNGPAHAGVARYDDVAVTSGTPLAATTVTTPTSDGNNQNNPVRASSITTTAPGQYVHAVMAIDSAATLTTPTGMTAVNLYNNVQSTGVLGRLAAFDVSQAAAGASGNKDSTASANAAWVTHTLALKSKPTKLAYSTPARSGAVNDCLGPITVETQNTAGVPVQPLTATEVGVASDGTGSFFNNAACDDALDPAERTIGTGATGTTFYYKPTDRGTGAHQITATATGLAQAQQTQTVKLSQTITFAGPSSPQVYGDSVDIGPATSDSTLPVTVTPSGGCGPLSGSNTTITSATTDCTLTASQAGDATYAPAQNVVRVIQTDPRPITVTADSGQTKVYNNGASNPTYTYTVTSGSLVPGDSFTGALARAAGETVAGSPYAINQGTLSAGTNYALSFVGANFTITARPLTLNANAASKTYGAADPTFNGTLTNFAPGHNNRVQAGVTGSESCSRSNPLVEAVGAYDDVISCTVGTLTADNYSFVVGNPADFTINKKQLAINAVANSKVYGQSDPTFAGTLSGFEFGEDATSAGVTGTASCSRTGTQEDVGIYNDVISCVQGTLAADNYSFGTGALADFTITKKQLTVDADPGTKVYGAGDPTFTATLNGFELGENRTSAGVTGAEDCDRSGTDQDVGTYEDVLSCTVGTLDAANYSFAAGGTNDFTITKKQLTVDADPKSKTYGEADPVFTSSLNGFEFGENRATGGVTGAEACGRSGTDEDAGTYTDVISCTVGTLAADNYSFAVGDTADFTINKKQLNVNADPASKVYGAADPAFSGTLSGFVNGEDATSAGVTGAEACSRTGTQEDVGAYDDVLTCTAGTLAAANYSFASGTAADFTINKKQLDINANPASKTYGESDPTFTGTLSGFENGEDATSANVTGAANCTRTGSDQDADTYTGVIACVQGTLAADNYSFGTGTAADFTINPKELDVDADPASKTYGQVDPTFTATLNGFAFGENRTTGGVTGAETCSRTGTDEDVGTYEDVLSCTVGTLAADNYTFVAGDTADFTINAKTVSASFTADNKEYDRTTDANISASDLDETDLEGADVVTLDDTNAEADFVDRNVGNGKSVTATGFDLAGADAGNYALSLDPETANITPKSVGASFAANDKQYDGTDDATVSNRSVDAAEVISPDVVTLTGGSADFSDAAVANDKTVTLTGASLGGADAGNYSLGTVATDQANITPKELTGTITAQNKVYDGDADADVTRGVTGKVGTEDVTLINGTATFDSANVGNNRTVTLTGASLDGTDMGNYTLSSAAITDLANITPKSVDGSFTADDKPYDGTNAATVASRSFDAGDLVNAGDVTALTGGTATFANAAVGNNKTVTLAGASLSGPQAANYAVGTVATDQANITPKELTGSFTAANKVYNGSSAATVSNRSLIGVVGTEDVDLAGGTASFSSPDVGTDKTVTLTGASLTGTAVGNYTLAAGAITDQADITRKSVTGGFTAADKDYDGTTAATIVTRSLSGVISGDSVSLTGGTANFGNPNPGVDKFVSGTGFTLSGADAGNYSLASVGSTTATIRQRDPSDTDNPPSDDPPTEEELADGATDELGDVKPLGTDFGGMAFAFAPEDQGKKLDSTNQPLFALGCVDDCDASAKKTVTLTTGGDASAAATKKLKLKTQNLSLAEGELGVVKLKLTKKQKKAIKKAKKAKLVVKVSVESGGETVTDKKAYKLKT